MADFTSQELIDFISKTNNLNTKDKNKPIRTEVERLGDKLEDAITKLEEAKQNHESNDAINIMIQERDNIKQQKEAATTLEDAAEKINKTVQRLRDKTRSGLQSVAGSRTLDEHEIELVDKFKSVFNAERQRIQDSKDARNATTNAKEWRRITDAINASKDRIQQSKDALGSGTDASRYAAQWVSSGEADADKAELEEALRLEKDREKALEKINELKRESYQLSRQERLEEKKSAEELKKGTERWGIIKQMFGEIKSQIKGGASTWMDYNEQAVSDAKRLGLTSSDAVHAYGTAMMKTSMSLIRNFGMSKDEAMKMQETFTKVTGKATLLSEKQLADVASASSLMGKENVAQAIQIMDTMGSTSDRAVELMDKNYARAKNAGLDTAKASEAFVKNMALANRMTFKDGVDGISKMTILSQRLKFNLESVANVADKVSTIEGAIETSAKLQMLGGTGAMYGSDPIALLYEGMNDNEALTERLAKTWSSQATFDRKTGEAQVGGLQKQIIKAQAEAYGMSFEDAMNMTKNQAKLNAFNGDNAGLVKRLSGEKGGEEKIAALQNKAQYSAESGWTITYNDKNGDPQTKTVEEVANNESIMNDVLGDQLDAEQDIKNNVRNIAQQLISLRQEKNSFLDWWSTDKATALDEPMQTIDDTAKWGMRGEGHGIMDAFEGIPGVLGGILGMTLFTGLKSVLGSKLVGNNFLRALGRGKFFGKGSSASAGTGAGATVGTGASAGTGATGGGTIGGGATGSAGSVSSRFGNFGSRMTAAKAASKNVFKTGAGKLGGALAVAGGVYTAYAGWNEANENYDYRVNQSQALRNRGRITSSEQNSRNSQASNQETREKSKAIGEGIGVAAGGIIGLKAGAAIGTAIGGPIGTIVGGAVGLGIGAIGGYIGKKIGEATSKNALEKESGALNKHIDEINDSDEEENIKKIVLPVESIDYNVALIANQLGVISAMPSRGNIYLEQENESEENSPQIISLGDVLNGKSQESQAVPQYSNGGFTKDGSHDEFAGIVHAGEWVASQKLTTNPQIVPVLQALDAIQGNNSGGIEGKPLEASKVYQSSNETSYTSIGNGNVNLTVDGEINLKLNGNNTGVNISEKDLIKIIHNSPEFQRQLSDIITKRQALNGNAGRNNNENADNRRGTTNNTYMGGI